MKIKEKLLQRKFYIVLIIIIFALIGAIFGITIKPNLYKSSATLALVNIEKNADGEEVNREIAELNKNIFNSSKALIQSEDLINELKVELGDNNSINYYLNNIKVKYENNSIVVVYESKNEDETINVENSIIALFKTKFENMNTNLNITILDNPHIISTGRLYNIIFSTLIGIIFGLLFNILYLLVIYKFENKIKNKTDVEKKLNLKLVGMLPIKPKNENLISLENSPKFEVKSYKTLVANMQFLNVTLKGKNTILITSSNKGEGKSQIVSNLGIMYASIGLKTIIIDANMNNSKIDKMFNLPNDLGLANFLSGLDNFGIENNELINSYIRDTSYKNLNIITSGTVPPNSVELLEQPKLIQMIKDLTVFFDVVIIDGPAILDAPDSLILSSMVLSTILVTEYRKTKKEDLTLCKNYIEGVGGKVLGVIINKVKFRIDTKTKIKLCKKNFKKIKGNIKEKVEKMLSKNTKKYLSEGIIEENNQDVFVENNENINNLVSTNTSEKILEEVATDSVKENLNVENIKVKEKKEKTFFNEAFTRFNKNNQIKEKIDDSKENDVENIENNLSKINSNNITNEEKFENVEENIIENIDETSNEINNVDTSKVTKNTAKEIKEKINIIIRKIKIFAHKIILLIKFNYAKAKKNKKEKLINKEKLANNSEKQVIENNNFNQQDEIENLNESISYENTKSVENIVEENNIQTISKDNDEDLKEENDKDKIKEDNLNELKEIITKNIIDNHLDIFENRILIIVNEERGIVRVFNKDCFVERDFRGYVASEYGFFKAHYSLRNINTFVKKLMVRFSVSKKEASRIDPLIYEALKSFDEELWTQKKTTFNFLEKYMMCLFEEIEIKEGESKKLHKIREVNTRIENLKKLGIEIEYQFVRNIFRSLVSTFWDRCMIRKYSKYIDNSTFNNRNSVIEEDGENNSNSKVQEAKDEELRKEQELLKQIKKEQREKERAEQKIFRENQKNEKKIIREKLKNEKIELRAKKIKEQRINEQLEEDNLYPKAKNSKMF